MRKRAEVSYAHRSAPAGQRFVQFADDPLPKWAVDVRPHESREADASVVGPTKPKE